ncbi:MAG TPA: trimeric intracellular cation channel family protein [Pseudonocardia sp.]|nr:trimeric intracellular cation channel family protein [Pseudonocardia sp.]
MAGRLAGGVLFLVLDLLGVAVLACSGALAAIQARLDVFGVVVLGVITSLGGGVIRDVLLGITPPSTLRQWPYLAVATLVGLGTFLVGPSGPLVQRTILVPDALGLALFVTTGTSTALTADAPTITACFVGAISGIGGGVVRDVLLREIPLVLHREIYALPAVLGAALVACGIRAGLPSTPVLLTAAVLIAGFRLLAIWRHWDAPRPNWARREHRREQE